MTYTVHTFQLGSSTVVTLPKDFAVKPGLKMKVSKKGKQIVFKEEKFSETEVDKLVEKLSGGLDLDYHPTPAEFNKILDEEYDKMLP